MQTEILNLYKDNSFYESINPGDKRLYYGLQLCDQILKGAFFPSDKIHAAFRNADQAALDMIDKTWGDKKKKYSREQRQAIRKAYKIAVEISAFILKAENLMAKNYK